MSSLPAEDDIKGIFAVKVKELKLLSHVGAALTSQIAPVVENIGSEERPAFYGSCMEVMRRFVVEVLRPQDVRHKIYLGLCALCPTVVEGGNFGMLFEFMELLSGLLSERGFLSWIRRPVSFSGCGVGIRMR